MAIDVINDDITRIDADCIVNAANETLLGGGGVDGAIHRGAGPELLQACRQWPQVRPGVRCPTGEARMTPGFELPAAHVIHTVGPVWHGGDHGEADQLAACYRHSLQLAAQESARRVVFPAISCGVFGYPPERAARVAIDTIVATLAPMDVVPCITLCCFGERLRATFQSALDATSTG